MALEDGYRESQENWASVLRGRGLRAPAVAIGDGALGFWSALRDVWPETTVQRDWCHKLANVLDKLPKRLRPRAKRALRDIMYAPTKADAERGIDAFVAEFEAKYPKAAACLAGDREALLAFFDFPAEHWLHLRTSNVIESVFATVRLRQRVTKGAGSRTKGLLMAYKLVAMAPAERGAPAAPGPGRRRLRRWRHPDGERGSEGGRLTARGKSRQIRADRVDLSGCSVVDFTAWRWARGRRLDRRHRCG